MQDNTLETETLKVKGKESFMHETFKDPVCGMDVTYESAQARSEYQGQTYYFCSLGCKEEFDKNPEKYVTHEHIR